LKFTNIENIYGRRKVKMKYDKEGFFEDEKFNLKKYVNMLLKRRWMILIGVLLCVVFTGIYSEMQPPVYTASSKFLASKIETLEGSATPDYFIKLLKGPMFLGKIAKRKFFSDKMGKKVDLITYYGIEADTEANEIAKTAEVISNNLSISTPRKIWQAPAITPIIIISYTSGDAELSATIVNVFYEELLKYNRDIRDSTAKNHLEKNLKLLKEAETELENFFTKDKTIIMQNLWEAERNRLKRNVEVFQEKVAQKEGQLELLKTEEQEQKPMIELIEKATPPMRKSSPKTRRNVILAGIASLLLLMELAFFFEIYFKNKAKG